MEEDIVEEIEVVTIASDDEDDDPSLNEILAFDMERSSGDRQVRRLYFNLTIFL